jgi:hypothetical protein
VRARARTSLAGALAGLALAAAPAAAHVEVIPAGDLRVGRPAELTVRVPSERSVATVGVTLRVPPEVLVSSVGAAPGWRVATTPGAGGRVDVVAFSGGRIGAGRHQDFTLLATPTAGGTAVWPAAQTYADGAVKPWTGPPADGETARAETGPAAAGPAPATPVLAAGAPAPAAAPGRPGADDDGSGAAVWLGLIAIGIAALAALGTGLLWASRPVALPPDDDP